MNVRSSSFSAGVLALACAATAASAQITERQMQAGLGLLPAGARAEAQVLVPDGDGFRVYRAGTNDWSCRISTNGTRLTANCHHRVLEGKLDLERRMAAAGRSGAAVRKELAAQLHSGHVSIPPGSVEITGSGELVDGSQVPSVMQGYYFVYFPFATSASVGVPDQDSGQGRPWLHQGGTADAHLMWVRSHTTTDGTAGSG